MEAAVKQVLFEGMPMREASRLYNVPLETLRRRVNGKVSLNCKPGPKTVLIEEETKLAEYLIEMSEMGYGITQEGVMGLAYAIAGKSKRPHPLQNRSAGRSWFEGFMCRRNLTIRTRTPLSYYCRAISANKKTITDFFGKLVTIVFKPNKVIAELSRRHVYEVSAAERGKTHTILSCVSASGFVLPPMMIYPRKLSVPDKVKEGAVPSTLFGSSPSGWINTELFVEWFKFFLANIPQIVYINVNPSSQLQPTRLENIMLTKLTIMLCFYARIML